MHLTTILDIILPIQQLHPTTKTHQIQLKYLQKHIKKIIKILFFNHLNFNNTYFFLYTFCKKHNNGITCRKIPANAP